MRLIVNNETIIINEAELTLKQLAELRGAKSGGTAMAVNGKLVKAKDWDEFRLHDGDSIVLITAAYGG